MITKENREAKKRFEEAQNKAHEARQRLYALEHKVGVDPKNISAAKKLADDCEEEVNRRHAIFLASSGDSTHEVPPA